MFLVVGGTWGPSEAGFSWFWSGFFTIFGHFFRFLARNERKPETASNQHDLRHTRCQPETHKRQQHHPHHSRVAHPRSQVSSVQIASSHAGGLEGDSCASRAGLPFVLQFLSWTIWDCRCKRHPWLLCSVQIETSLVSCRYFLPLFSHIFPLIWEN